MIEPPVATAALGATDPPTDPPVSVRRAVTAADCAPVRPLVHAHARHERSDVVVPAHWADRVAREVAAGRLDLFVAASGGTPIGYAAVTTDVATWSAERYAHLDCLFVAAGHRDRGVGRLLVGVVFDHVRGRGLGELQWQTPAWNDDAVRFYRRLGARHATKERFVLAAGRAT